MTTRLFIAEKPSVANAIVAELGIKQKAEGCIIVKSGDIVSWCFGHLMELSEPDFYLSDAVPKLKNGRKIWRDEDLPIFPATWHKEVKKDAKKQLKILGGLLKKCDQVVNCGDPDREGQLLVDEVLEHFGNKKSVLRYWVSAQDSASVQKGLKNLQPNNKYQGMLQAAKGRERADWLFGMNLSRAYTLATKRGGNFTLLSVGRVQTPTLNLVAKRDLAIKNFKPVPYFVIKGTFGEQTQFTATFKPDEGFKGLDEQKRLISADAAKAVFNAVSSVKLAKVVKVENKQRVLDHPKAFSLADLQQLASSKWGFSAQHTLDICQNLYEKHKLTSYPRSDCQYLPESQFHEAKAVLDAVKANYPELAKLISMADVSIKSKTWDDKKITAHHGLIPTMKKGDLSALSADEKKIYDAIVRRYVAQFFPPCIMGSSSVTLAVGAHSFVASGSIVLKQGFKAVSGMLEIEDETSNKEPEDNQKIPQLQQGQSIKCGGFKIDQKKTTPPPYFTEGSLIKAMENIHSVVDDPAHKKFLKEGDGIGTSATRAAIISGLKDKGFLVQNGKKVNCTPLGFKLLSSLPDLVKNPVLTAIFEAKLKDVEAGKMTLEAFEKEQREYVQGQVAKAKGMTITIG